MTATAVEARVREDFGKQAAMRLIGAEMTVVEAGRVVIELPYRDDLTQQHGFIHAGIVGTIADSAGGYAALSLMPEGSEVLAIEYKMNLLSPADGARLRATGRVIRSGRRISVCELSVESLKADGTSKTCAWGLQTVTRATRDASGRLG